MDLTGLDLDRWAPWTPDEVARILDGVDATWYVLAGWALDLFLGRRTRAHDDIEIGVRADEFGAIRDALHAFELFAVGDGRAVPATDEALAVYRQTWVREPASGAWRLDVIRETWDDDAWVYRRDPRIRLHRSQLVAFTDAGVPYCRPEVVLLFKARSARPKDQQDFRVTLPFLDHDGRSWLAGVLAQVSPGHPWLSELRE